MKVKTQGDQSFFIFEIWRRYVKTVEATNVLIDHK